MSAVAAILDLDTTCDHLARARAMTAAMRYAALDGETHWSEKNVALGYCATNSTAEAREAQLPLLSQDGRLALVMDGYIGNREDVVRHLRERGAVLRNRSDAEIVLQAWLLMGDLCLDLLDGEFALIIADRPNGEVYLARDHMGLRPLFYWFDGKRLVAASHIGGVLAGMDSQPPPNHGFLAEILTFEYVTPGETVWSGIERVRPAHVVKIGAGGQFSRKYWSVPDEPKIRYGDDREYIEHYREVFTECVRRASRSDRLLAVECSGGLDSSAVFALADELHRGGQLAAPDIAGFTLAPPTGSSADEMQHARAVSGFLQRDLTECPLYLPPADEILAQARHSGNIAPYPNTFMLRGMGQTIAQRGARAVLNGQGGDQFLDGNGLYYHEAFAERELGRLAGYIRTDLREIGPFSALAMLGRGALSILLPHRLLRSYDNRAWSDAAISKRVEQYDWLSPSMRVLLHERIKAAKPQSRYIDRYKQAKVTQPLIGHLLDMLAEQNARNGVEARTPMMSRSFVEFFGRTPERIRRRGRQTRVVHRQAMAGKLPGPVLNRTNKAGFSLAFERYGEEVDEYLSLPLAQAQQELVDPAQMRLVNTKCRDPQIDAVHNWVVWGTLSVLDLTSDQSNANTKDGHNEE